ncbi:MAG: tRNA (cytidine(56)-2'-O)-methyltransferase [Thermoplasmata archaeon]
MITVLRLGHRPERDKRVTTHVCLVSRALGADRIVISTRDDNVVKSVSDVVSRFGGEFQVESGINWKKYIQNFQGIKIHLTMYGIPIQNAIQKIPKDKDLLIIVGSEKVPSEVYKLADFNIAVTNQPHSEVAGLAIFLDKYYEGKELEKKFKGIMRVIPSEHGKNLKIFSREECISILRNLGMDEKLISHSIAVANLSFEIGKRCNADIPLLECGALFHDIGRIRENGISHGIVGSEMVLELGYPIEVANIVKRHVGGGLEQEEAKKLGLKEFDLMPETLEEKIVCHADNLIKRDKKIKLEEVLEEYRKMGLHNQVDRIRSLHRYLSDLINMDIDDLDV